MFKKIIQAARKFITKRALPILMDNLKLEIKTVEHARTKYLDVDVKVFHWQLLHRQLKLADITSSQAGNVVNDIKAIIEGGK